jgi:threonine/homoserine/homoserine lactone efflux protein
MGMLPGFFDLTRVTWLDITAICALSLAVPLIGNLILAASVDRVRGILKSPNALKRMNITAGVLLLAVALVIAVG